MQEPVYDIIAQAMVDAGIRVATHVPGAGGTKVYRSWLSLTRRDDPITFHEEVAFTIAHGAAITGTRSACLIKIQGLIKAGNSVIDSLSAGNTAGFVILIFHDSAGGQPDSIVDAEPLIKGIGLPYTVSSGTRIYEDLMQAIRKSEEISLPQAILIDTTELEKKSYYVREKLSDKPPEYRRDIIKHMVIPLFASYQYSVLNHKKKNIDWTIIEKPEIPEIPEGLPADWQKIISSYVRLFSIFKEIRGRVVTGDTGVSTLFALPPYHCVDINTNMGGSIPLATGAYLAGHKNVWALSGDFSFIATGYLGLTDVLLRNIPLKIILFYNARAAATGGQPFPEGILERLLNSYREHVMYIKDPQNAEEVKSILNLAKKSRNLCIVVADYRGM